MLAAAVTFYEVVKFVHISSAILAFGATYAYPFAFAVAERTDPRSMPTILRYMRRFESFMLGPALIVLLASGIYMAVDLELFDEAWVSSGLLIILVLGGLAGAYFAPRERRLLKLAERDIAAAGEGQVTFGDEFMRLYRQTNVVGALAGVLVLIAVFLMTAKP